MGAMQQIEEQLRDKGKRAKAKKPDATEKGPVKRRVIATPTPEEVDQKKGGRVKIADMPEAQRKREIDELLENLAGAEDVDEKKRIRRSLRARGHTGGLGKKVVKKEKAEAKVEAKAA